MVSKNEEKHETKNNSKVHTLNNDRLANKEMELIPATENFI